MKIIRKILLLALFVLPALNLLLHVGEFPISPGADFSDLLITHYPNALFLRQSLLDTHQVPLWNPTILSGYPFAADPLSGIDYPPGWLAVLLPGALGFNLMIVFHLVLGGVGLYLFLRRRGVGQAAALYSGLAFTALPKLYAHMAAGHVTLIYAVCWTPWLLLAADSTRQPGQLRRWVLPGGVLGLIALADVRWAAYAGLSWLAFELFEQVRKKERDWRSWAKLVAHIGSNTGTALLAAAPLLVPLMEYTRLATRSQMSPAENLTMSLPPGQLLGLVFPYLNGSAEWAIYPGAVTCALALLAVCLPYTRRRSSYWLGLALVSVLWSLGSYLTPLAALARLPGLDLLRVPPRALFLTGIGLVVAAGYALDELAGLAGGKFKGWDGARLILFGVGALVGLTGLMAVILLDKPALKVQFGWGAVIFVIEAALLFLALKRKRAGGALLLACAALNLVDISAVNVLAVEFRPVGAVLSQSGELAVYLSAQKHEQGAFRIYSPSYSLPQQTAADCGLQLADGVDPLQLNSYVSFMEEATGVPSDGYSVTLPPYANADPQKDNQFYLPDAQKLGWMNVKYVTSEFEINGSAFNLLATYGNTRLYENNRALPRAWVQPVDGQMGENIRAVDSLTMTPDRIGVQARGPGLLVLSEVDYPGWEVLVDGRSAHKEVVAGLLRGVKLSPGEHQVEFVFRPLSVYLGLALGSFGWLFWILFILLDLRRKAHADR